MAGSGRSTVPAELQSRLEEEVGDLFFVLVNIARYLSLDPESALRKTNRKFKRRFQWMESRLQESGLALDQTSMEDLEALWQQAKREESKKQKPGRDPGKGTEERIRERIREKSEGCLALRKKASSRSPAFSPARRGISRGSFLHCAYASEIPRPAEERRPSG